MCPERFILRRNIDKFHSRLLIEEDPGTRDVLFRLLIEEEDRYGAIEEKIAIIKERIAVSSLLIEKQNEILIKVIKDGEDPAQANRILLNLVEARELLLRHLCVVERQSESSLI